MKLIKSIRLLVYRSFNPFHFEPYDYAEMWYYHFNMGIDPYNRHYETFCQSIREEIKSLQKL